jgi:SAM-dependent methyltransferase
VPSGSVTGVDLSPQVIDQARAHLSTLQDVSNVSFQTGNVLEGLPFQDDTFDVVFCNQTLLHIPEPVKAMKEMRRVVKSRGGFLACREADFPFRFHPLLPGVQQWMKYFYLMLYWPDATTVTDNPLPQYPPFGPEYRGGSLLHVWAREAGFDTANVKRGGSVTMEDPKWFARVMTERIQDGTAEKFKKFGATDDDIESMISDFKAWSQDEDAWMAILQVEVLCFA